MNTYSNSDFSEESNDFWANLFNSFTSLIEETACPACKSSERCNSKKLGPSHLHRCRNCSLVYLSPRLRQEVISKLYTENSGDLSSNLERILRKLMVSRKNEMLSEFPRNFRTSCSNLSLLDFGSGWGHFLEACQGIFASVQGIELSRKQAEHARSSLGLKVDETDVFKQKWSHQVDCITAWELIEHLENPAEFLNWARDHLRPRGYLVLSTPNYNSIYRRMLGENWYYHIPTQHLSYFTSSSLGKLLAKQGFQAMVMKTSGRSLLSEKNNGHNHNDDSQPLHSQWIQNARIRDRIEWERDFYVDKDKVNSKFIKQIQRWKSSFIWHLWNPILRNGMGDQLRVYAQKI